MSTFAFILNIKCQASTPIPHTRTTLERTKGKGKRPTGRRGRKDSDGRIGRCWGGTGPRRETGGAEHTWIESDHLWPTRENQLLPTVCPESIILKLPWCMWPQRRDCKGAFTKKLFRMCENTKGPVFHLSSFGQSHQIETQQAQDHCCF